MSPSLSLPETEGSPAVHRFHVHPSHPLDTESAAGSEPLSDVDNAELTFALGNSTPQSLLPLHGLCFLIDTVLGVSSRKEYSATFLQWGDY